MLFRDVINLVGDIAIVKNDMGDPIELTVKREVFADKKSIRQNEFYQAASTGLRPELMFVIRTIEYEQEPKLEYPIGSDKLYNIIRTYDKDGEFTELICSGLVSGV